MRQRLHIARALINEPRVLFLDEPTIGLDPVGAQELRQYIPRLSSEGRTILLTTHYMYEADALCHTIGIVNHGQLVAIGTPGEIKRHFSAMTVYEITPGQPRPGLVEQLSKVEGVQRVATVADGAQQKLVVYAQVDAPVVPHLRAVVGTDAATPLPRDPTLEEAYLQIVQDT
jgi:ABC-2 type transport system ATP-binding protein